MPNAVAAEIEDDRLTALQGLRRVARLPPPEPLDPVLLDDLRDRQVTRILDVAVVVDDRAVQQLAQRARQRRLPRTHEADQREMCAEGRSVLVTQCHKRRPARAARRL